MEDKTGKKGPQRGSAGKGQSRKTAGSGAVRNSGPRGAAGGGKKPPAEGEGVRSGKKGTSRGAVGRRSASPGENKGSGQGAGAKGSGTKRSESPAGKKGAIRGQGSRRTRPGTGKRKRETQSGERKAGAGEEGVRLNKYLAASGICSRREADKLISSGYVTVNSKKVTEMGTKVKPSDEVRYRGKKVDYEKKIYLLLNKPKDFVTTTRDPKERKTVMDLVRNACRERIYPVGRLDRNSTGVLLFTNDGELASRLTHPGFNKKKIYHVFLDKALPAADLKKLAGGITLEDGFIRPDAISYVHPERLDEVGLEIHSGRNRVVRRMFEFLGYQVVKLDRVYFAGLTKKNLPRGKWRFLTGKEISRLKTNAYE